MDEMRISYNMNGSTPAFSWTENDKTLTKDPIKDFHSFILNG